MQVKIGGGGSIFKIVPIELIFLWQIVPASTVSHRIQTKYFGFARFSDRTAIEDEEGLKTVVGPGEHKWVTQYA